MLPSSLYQVTQPRSNAFLFLLRSLPLVDGFAGKTLLLTKEA
jgi:hypothetical protein